MADKGNRAQDPALLVVGLLYHDEAGKGEAEKKLVREFGAVAETSPAIPFDFTDYYTPEMGADLQRQWICFDRPVVPGVLVEAKLTTIGLEIELTSLLRPELPGRVVNLDPGVLTLHNFVLATTKNQCHRIYLGVGQGLPGQPRSPGVGIFGELTLMFRSGRYEPLPWTYPDYRTACCQGFLISCRNRLLGLREAGQARR